MTSANRQMVEIVPSMKSLRAWLKQMGWFITTEIKWDKGITVYAMSPQGLAWTFNSDSTGKHLYKTEMDMTVESTQS